MALINDPRPRGEALSWKSIDWPVRRNVTLRPPVPAPSARFSDVSSSRRSQRWMTRPSVGQVLELLQLSSQLHGEWIFQTIDRHNAPSVSAGGLHGIDIVFGPPTGCARLFRFVRRSGRLEELVLADPKQVVALRSVTRECLPDAEAMIVCLLADVSKYHAAYEFCESLIWRDSGALLQVIAMAAYALGLAACPLGPHGKQLLPALGLDAQRTMACGLIAIGKYS